MKLRKKNAFTLIELVAVLVIMAIIALIVTPLVMSIIRKARISADKRSVDAYGRSIELAIAGYLMDNGSFPTSIEQLTIEYSGDEVVCSTTNLNSDSSIYLAGCIVGGRSTGDYTYGEDKTPPAPTYTAYSVGDQVTYNSINYYAIKDSDTTEDSVTLLKAEPLIVAEVNQFGGVGTVNNHVNMYATDDSTKEWYQKAYDRSGYGVMQYYSSSTCVSNGDKSGCKNDYELSEIKYVVDAWKTVQATEATEARLMTYEEALDNSEMKQFCTPSCYDAMAVKYDWLYGNYKYWLMTPAPNSTLKVWGVGFGGALSSYFVQYFVGDGVVRPVIVLPKSALSA